MYKDPLKKKSKILTPDQLRFRKSQLHMVDAWVQQMDFTGLNSNEMTDEMRICVIIQKMFKTITETWSPRKSQEKDRGLMCLYNLLSTTIIARGRKTFYGANVETFLCKRILKMIHSDQIHRDNALDCVLRLIRGPDWQDDFEQDVTSYLPSQRENNSSSSHEGKDAGWEYGCIMGKFENCETTLWRPEALDWIANYLFGLKKPKPRDFKRCQVDLLNADKFVAVVAQICANDFNVGSALVRDLLNIPKHKSNVMCLVGLRAVRLMLDDATGFMSHATQTRVNRVAITDEETIVLGLQIAAQGGIQNTLKLVDAAAGVSVLGLNSQPLPFVSLLDNPQADGSDAARAAHKELRNRDPKLTVPLAIIFDALRCLPYLSWRSGLNAFVNAKFLVHSDTVISSATSLALQRTMLRYPAFRPAVIEASLALLADPSLADETTLSTILSHEKGMIDLWARLLVNAAHAPNTAELAEQENVFADAGDYPTWMGKVEAAVLVALCHAVPECASARFLASKAPVTVAVRAKSLLALSASTNRCRYLNSSRAAQRRAKTLALKFLGARRAARVLRCV